MFWIWVLIAVVVLAVGFVLLARRNGGRTSDRSDGPDSATNQAYSDAARSTRQHNGGGFGV